MRQTPGYRRSLRRRQPGTWVRHCSRNRLLSIDGRLGRGSGRRSQPRFRARSSRIHQTPWPTALRAASGFRAGCSPRRDGREGGGGGGVGGGSGDLAVIVDPGWKSLRSAESIKDNDGAGRVAHESVGILNDADNVSVVIGGSNTGGFHSWHVESHIGSVGMPKESVSAFEGATVDIGSDDIAGVCDSAWIRDRKSV